MVKALLRKQFREFLSIFFFDNKTGKKKSKSGVAKAIIFAILLFAILFGSMIGMCFLIASSLIKGADTDWIYFGIIGVSSLLLGVIGSIFNTYSTLYNAKDNELLLSMPINPSKILFARMVSIYVTSLLFTSMMWLPAVVTYWIIKASLGLNITILQIILPVLLDFVLSFFVTVSVCILGYIVAIISSRFKKNRAVIMVLSVGMFLGYYYFCLKLNSIITEMLLHIDSISMKIKTYFYPIYELAKGSTGDIFGFIIFLLITAGVFFLCCFILSKNFIKIVTTKKSSKKTVYVEKNEKSNSIRKALLIREFRHFGSNTTYMMNCGLGIPMFIIAMVVLLIKKTMIIEYMDLLSNTALFNLDILPLAIVAIVCMVGAMDMDTAPSISLEGKNLWVIQTLPIDIYEVIKAKRNMHAILNAPFTVILTVEAGLIFGFDIVILTKMAVISFLFNFMIADLGLFFNILNPNFTWTSEIVPIKQGMPVLYTMLSSWIIAALPVAIFFLVKKYIDMDIYLVILIVLLVLIFFVLENWLEKKGSKKLQYM